MNNKFVDQLRLLNTAVGEELAKLSEHYTLEQSVENLKLILSDMKSSLGRLENLCHLTSEDIIYTIYHLFLDTETKIEKTGAHLASRNRDGYSEDWGSLVFPLEEAHELLASYIEDLKFTLTLEQELEND